MAQALSAHTPTAAALRKGNRLLAGAFAVSLAVHALLLSLQFRMPDAKPATRDPGLAVVLVNTRHAQAPEKADVLAQANVDAGGTSEQEARPTSPLPPQPTQREGDALVEAKQRTQEPVREQKQVVTREKSPAKVAAAPAKVEQPTPTPAPQPRGLDLLDSAAAIARLEAEIDRKLDEIAKRPRRTSIGAKAREYRFAQYVEDWRLKVERVGTLNYPEAARGRLYGSLLLRVSIKADGSVEEVVVNRSSGHKLLDEAAVRIVQLAAPYAPFPPDIRRDTDIIEITRTWTFTNTNQVRAN
ncbi:energy transducer TonB [Thauera sp. Sel9]|uniref:energy transducer TonB n=1 Tax=Thauera sp. Sel9 TaxID=2974299 RepID=UPI0021E15DA5|nr:energy transducer TonB [Thauera sp. Sel9]MCV2219700.1 energy transducer TonB [Thauera sp. Sel9]